MAESLSRRGVTEPVALQTAILRDTTEHTETTPDELEETFGARPGPHPVGSGGRRGR